MAASSNTLITPTIIAKEALMQLKNNLVMGELVFRDYTKEFVKVGRDRRHGPAGDRHSKARLLGLR
jgi:hypothetical protein